MAIEMKFTYPTEKSESVMNALQWAAKKRTPVRIAEEDFWVSSIAQGSGRSIVVILTEENRAE